MPEDVCQRFRDRIVHEDLTSRQDHILTADLEATWKRHYYYCRSRRPDATASRRRSCVACVRAKTRCIWLVNAEFKACCVRCNDRGTKCDYNVESRPILVSGQDLIPRRPARDTATYKSDTSSFLPTRPLSTHIQKYQPLPATFDTPLNDSWNDQLDDIDALVLGNQGIDNQAIDPAPTTLAHLSATLITGISSLQPNALQVSERHPFSFRAVTKPSHIPLVSLATRILRSYPFIILQEGSYPPFMSPEMFSWATTGQGPPQQVGFL
jgi:hypothetical protein